MPPENTILIGAALAFMGLALLAIIGIGWGTRELVKDMHGIINNKHSGIDAIWAAINGLRKDFTDLGRPRSASGPDDVDG